MRLWYSHYNSRSAARVGPRTHVILALHKGPHKITTFCKNLSVCRRQKNILYRRNDGFANKHTKQCSSWTPGMVRQKIDDTIPRKMKSNDHAEEINTRDFNIGLLRTTTTIKHATAHDQNHRTVHFFPRSPAATVSFWAVLRSLRRTTENILLVFWRLGNTRVSSSRKKKFSIHLL